MTTEVLLINPRKRSRRGRKSSKHRARKHNPVRSLRVHRKHRKTARRNPLSLRGMSGGFMGKATGALMGAGGAILNDALYGYAPFPAMFKTGPLSIVSKAMTALGVGYLASFAVGKQRGAQLAEGALTVLAYQVVKPMVATVLPALAGDDIEGMGYYSPGMILQDSLSPLPDLNQGTPLQAYLNGMGSNVTAGQGYQRESDMYDPSIDAYIQ